MEKKPGEETITHQKGEQNISNSTIFCMKDYHGKCLTEKLGRWKADGELGHSDFRGKELYTSIHHKVHSVDFFHVE